jgi:uncharacterized protein (TIGR02145 family)
MKTKHWKYLLISLSLFLLVLSVCKKDELMPTIETIQITNITEETAVVSYKIVGDGGAMVMQHGVCWSLDANPTISLTTKTMDGSGTGSVPGNYLSNVTGLENGKSYHVRAYATNSVGTAYGKDLTFSTKQIYPPEGITTKSVSAISSSAAISGGSISGAGGSTKLVRGICWSINPDPTTVSSLTADTISSYDLGSSDSFTSIMSGLTVNTKYFIRAYASNQAGVTYGNQVTVTTGSVVIEIEGKLYNSVTIGTQTWLTENLATSTYNDGKPILMVDNQAVWNNIQEPGYCWFNNNRLAFGTTNGALYNWYAVNTGNLCPVGWHVPSDAEWTELSDYLGSESGNKIRKPEIMQWTDYPSYANNCLFWAKPAGIRDTIIGFETTGECDPTIRDSHWWSSSSGGGSEALSRWLYSSELSKVEFSKKNGFSVRCIKN